MKKLFLTLIVSLALCGSVFAQGYETHWPGFNGNFYEDQDGLVAAIIIDGEPITVDYEGWNALEVAAFITKTDGTEECRAVGIYLNDEFVLEFGDPYPVTWGDAIFYTNPGEELHFKMYDHSRNIEYIFVTALQYDEPLTLLTGDAHFEGWDNPDDVISLSFVSPPTFTKDIIGYGEGDNYWYFIASPVEEPVVPSAENGFLTEAYDFFYFDQSYLAAEWRGYDVENFVVENGKGYLYASQENTTLTFTGTPFTGDDGYAEVELVYDATEGHEWYGWNLVGNPFADSAYADRPFYRLDPETGEYLECTEDDIVPMMEGIFVETLEQENETMIFTAATGDDTGGTGGGNMGKLVINVNQGRGVSDRAIVRFDGKSTLSKLQFKSNSTQVYIPVDGKDYAVANAPEMGEMPVSFKAGNNGTYTMSFSNKNVEFNYLHLIDNMTGADVDLLVNPSYTFDASTTDYASRFKLVFATGNNGDDNFAFFSNGSFIISNEGEAVLQVVDVTGRILNNETINGSANVYVNAAPGVYMLRLINGDNVKVQKVVVK